MKKGEFFQSGLVAASPFVVLVLVLTLVVFPGIGNPDVMAMYVDAARHARNGWWSLPLEILWSGALAMGFSHYGWFYFVSNILIALGGGMLLFLVKPRGLLLFIVSTCLVFCPIFLVYLCRFTRGNLGIGALLCGISLALFAREASRARNRYVLKGLSLTMLILATVARIDFVAAAFPVLVLFVSADGAISRKLFSLFTWAAILLFAVFGLTYSSVSHGSKFAYTMHLDLVGMSYHAGVNLYDPAIQTDCPEHLQRAFRSYEKTGTPPVWIWMNPKGTCPTSYEILKNNWVRVVLEHPRLYLTHRIHRVMTFTGFASLGRPDPLDAWTVNIWTGRANEGIARNANRHSNAIRHDLVVDTIIVSPVALAIEGFGRKYQRTFFFEGAFYMILHLLALVLSLRKSPGSLITQIVSASGLSHFILISFTASCSLPRFVVWTYFSAWISFLIALVYSLQSKKLDVR